MKKNLAIWSISKIGLSLEKINALPSFLAISFFEKMEKPWGRWLKLGRISDLNTCDLIFVTSHAQSESIKTDSDVGSQFSLGKKELKSELKAISGYFKRDFIAIN